MSSALQRTLYVNWSVMTNPCYLHLSWCIPELSNILYLLPEEWCKLQVLCNRVLARISKMPVQSSNFKISTRPDLTTYLLQILIPATFNSLLCQKGHFTLQPCPRSWFVRKIVAYLYIPKVKIEKSSLKLLPVL